jgi:nickel-dependent lactate racemase
MSIGQSGMAGYLTSEEIRNIVVSAIDTLPIQGKKVLVIIPDSTRSMPMPMMFDLLLESLAGTSSRLDFLIALGTHSPMSDEQLGKLLGREVYEGRIGDHLIINHRWQDSSVFATIGTIPAEEIQVLSEGLLSKEILVALNKITSSSAVRSFPTRWSASRVETSISFPASLARK